MLLKQLSLFIMKSEESSPGWTVCTMVSLRYPLLKLCCFCLNKTASCYHLKLFESCVGVAEGGVYNKRRESGEWRDNMLLLTHTRRELLRGLDNRSSSPLTHHTDTRTHQHQTSCHDTFYIEWMFQRYYWYCTLYIIKLQLCPTFVFNRKANFSLQ